MRKFRKMFQVKCEFSHITWHFFFKNKNRLALVLSDTCSYIDRLGSVDSPRPRNHPFEVGAKFNPLSLFTLVANTASGSIRTGENFLPIKKTRPRYASPMYFQRTLKTALISSCIKQYCDKTRIMSYKLTFCYVV